MPDSPRVFEIHTNTDTAHQACRQLFRIERSDAGHKTIIAYPDTVNEFCDQYDATIISTASDDTYGYSREYAITIARENTMPDLATFRAYPVAGGITPANNKQALQNHSFRLKLKYSLDHDDTRLFLYAGTSNAYATIHEPVLRDLNDQLTANEEHAEYDVGGHMPTAGEIPSRLSRNGPHSHTLTVTSVPGTTTHGLELQYGDPDDGFNAILTPRQRVDFHDTIHKYLNDLPHTSPDMITVVTNDGSIQPSLNHPEQ